MRKLHFENCHKLLDTLISVNGDLDLNKTSDVIVVAGYDIVQELAFYLVSEYGYDLYDVTFQPCEISGYCGAYIIQWDKSGLWIQPVQYGDKFIRFCREDVVFVHEDVDKDLWLENKEVTLIRFTIDEDEDDFECDGDCDHCKCSDLEEPESLSDDKVQTKLYKNENDEIVGFDLSFSNNGSYWSTSYYSSNPRDVVKVAEEKSLFSHLF